jgi:hypothetical protein
MNFLTCWKNNLKIKLLNFVFHISNIIELNWKNFIKLTTPFS